LLWCGCKVGQNTSHNWLLPLPHQATIQLDIDPAELGRTFRPSVALSGDARATLAALLAEVLELRRPSWLAECARVPGGAAAARPGGRIVTVSGDGGFSYGLGELATHALLGTHTTHIVLNNGTLGWLAMWQRMFFDGLRQSVDLESASARPAFAEAARSLGCAGFGVDQPSGLGEALDAALAADGPAVLEVRVDPAATPIHSYRRR